MIPRTSDQEVPGLVFSLLRYRTVVAFFILATAAAGYWWSAQQSPVYQGSVRLLVTDPNRVGSFREILQPIEAWRYPRNEVAVVTSPAVLQRAATIYGDDITPDEVGARAAVEEDLDRDLLTLRATGETEEDAVALANAIAEGYEQVKVDNFRRLVDEAMAQLEAERSQLQDRLQSMEAELQTDPDDPVLQAELTATIEQLKVLGERSTQLAIDGNLSVGGVQFREPARLEGQIQPRPKRYAAAGALMGLLLGGATAFLINWRRLAEFSARHSRVLNAPLLTEVPDFRKCRVRGFVPAATDPRSPPSEAYQFLIASLSSSLRDSREHTILVTSALPSEGKTVTALNMAIAATRDGRRVLLVDADMRARGLAALWRREWEACRGIPGLNNEQLRIVELHQEGRDPAGYFRSPEFTRFLAELSTQADLIIIDSPPLLGVADALEMAEHVDGTVIVTSTYTPADALGEVRRRLDLVGVPVLGYIVNGTSPSSSLYSYGGYGSYPSPGGEHSSFITPTPEKNEEASVSPSQRRRSAYSEPGRRRTTIRVLTAGLIQHQRS